jgi:hypothetical protein
MGKLKLSELRDQRARRGKCKECLKLRWVTCCIFDPCWDQAGTLDSVCAYCLTSHYTHHELAGDENRHPEPTYGWDLEWAQAELAQTSKHGRRGT